MSCSSLATSSFPSQSGSEMLWEGDNARSTEILPLSLPELKRLSLMLHQSHNNLKYQNQWEGKDGRAEERSTSRLLQYWEFKKQASQTFSKAPKEVSLKNQLCPAFSKIVTLPFNILRSVYYLRKNLSNFCSKSHLIHFCFR